MSEEVEVVDNGTPAVADNVAPAVETAVAPAQADIGKFGELLKYASDDIKEAKTWEKFKDVDMATGLKAIVDMDKWTGKRGDIPQDWGDAEAVKDFWAKVGAPTDVEGYNYTFDEATSTALGSDAEGLQAYIGEMKTLGLKHNFRGENFDGFLADAMAIEVQQRVAGAEASAQKSAADEKMISDEWGTEFEAMGQAVQALEKHYGISAEEADAIEANPATLILLGRIAKDLDEKGQVGNVFSQTSIGLNDEMAEAEGAIRDILSKNGRDVNDPALDVHLARRDRIRQKLS